mgnify:CR=1 FL=1
MNFLGVPACSVLASLKAIQNQCEVSSDNVWDATPLLPLGFVQDGVCCLCTGPLFVLASDVFCCLVGPCSSLKKCEGGCLLMG